MKSPRGNVAFVALVAGACAMSLALTALTGCSTTWAVDTIVGTLGVRFNGDQVQDKIVSSCVVRQKHSPIQWENDGRYSVEDREIWWRQTAYGEKTPLRGNKRLNDLGCVLYPMTGTNGWIGLTFAHIEIVIVVVLDDVVRKGQPIKIYPDYDTKLKVAEYFFSQSYLPMSEEQEEKAFDLFLFDGNKRLMYRTFSSTEQYFEYDALAGTLRKVTTNRVAEVKSRYTDLYRIPMDGHSRYWKEDDDGLLRFESKYYRPLDPVADAVPQWEPDGRPRGQPLRD